MGEVTRQEIHGVQVLIYPDNSLYVDVAERVRLVHKVHSSFSFERGEVLPIKDVWIYRAVITVGGKQYIGDAEIHFDAPLDTPDGTNPITCGQTSAVGNALSFAGFGDLQSILERLGEQVDEHPEEGPSDALHRVIEGIRVVMLDTVPYVPVAERVRQVHHSATSFSIDSVDVLEVNGVWIYRATICVDGKRAVGDAEIFFDAPEQTIDRKYPVTCGQTSAVGNALAFAGFGDVHSILERQGKHVEGLSFKPSLASADAVVRARRYADAHSKISQASQAQQMLAPGTSTSVQCGEIGVQARITPSQLERLRLLYERLGESEPTTLNQMTFTDAEQEMTRLQVMEEELFRSVEAALEEEATPTSTPPSPASPAQGSEIMSHAEVGQLKRAWIKAYQVSGYIPEVQKKWLQFKKDVCHGEVNDESMSRLQYDLLTTTLEQRKQDQVRPSGRRAAASAKEHT